MIEEVYIHTCEVFMNIYTHMTLCFHRYMNVEQENKPTIPPI